MRKKIVAGNWKMNTRLEEGLALAREVAAGSAPKEVKLIVAPPFTHLAAVSGVLSGSTVELSAQNCADEPSGAYTGEVSAAMLSSAGCRWTILGHSERRQYYGETDARLVRKIRLALDEGLGVIFCVGENLEQREAGQHFAVVKSQIENVLWSFTAEELRRVVIAYEPVWAIGTGKTASADQAQEIHAHIRALLAEKFGPALAEETSILYGGSCKPSNAAELFSRKDIDGGLIGGAALKAEDFLAIARSF